MGAPPHPSLSHLCSPEVSVSCDLEPCCGPRPASQTTCLDCGATLSAFSKKWRCRPCTTAANTRTRWRSQERNDLPPEVIEAKYAEAIAGIKAKHLRLAEHDVWSQSGRWTEFVTRNTPDTSGVYDLSEHVLRGDRQKRKAKARQWAAAGV